MKRITIFLAFALCLWMVPALFAQIKSENDQKENIETNLLKLRSQNFNDRYLAVEYFSRLNEERLSEEIVNEIINLFNMENERHKRFDEYVKKPHVKIGEVLPKELLYQNSEKFGLYYVNLATIIGKSNDKRALPLLVEYFPDFHLINNYGEPAIGPVIKSLETTDNSGRKINMLSVLRYGIKNKKVGYTAQGETRNQIKTLLIKYALSDKDFEIKSTALNGLREVDDEDLIPVFKKIASDDPWHLEEGLVGPTDKNPAPGKKIIRYPLREIAQNELSKRKK